MLGNALRMQPVLSSSIAFLKNLCLCFVFTFSLIEFVVEEKEFASRMIVARGYKCALWPRVPCWPV